MSIHESLDDELRDRAAQYVLGTLPESDAANVRSHLASCTVCRAEVDALALVARALCCAAASVEPRPELWERVSDRVDADLSSNANRASRVQVWKNWTASPGARQPFLFVPGNSGEWEATSVDGIEARQLFVDRASDRATFLVRMASGTAYPAHVHAGPEECFVLEGDLTVGDVTMHAGDYQRAERGSRHGLQTSESGCVLLLVSSLADEIVR